MTIMNTSKKEVIRYVFLPQVYPRLNTFFSSGFSNLAYFMALVYRAVNLLPKNHEYLKTESIGKFNIRHVLSAAAENLTFNMKHVDQIIIFFALIAGIVILAMQFFILLGAFLISPATAQTTIPNNLFTTPNPTNDLALRFLDSVFGVPGIFESGELAGGESALHTALHGLFQFYSIGLLIIAVMIVIYFIFAILAETAQTGTPFGKRYNHVWAPIRLVAAIGLLIPISYGMNSGQWLTLYAAKFGSGFATNGWIAFNDTISENYIPKENLVGEPNAPNLKDVSAFMMIVHACKSAYSLKNSNIGEKIDAWILDKKEGREARLLSTTQSISNLVDGDTVTIRFGENDKDKYASETNGVYPYCGEITLSNLSKKPAAEPEAPSGPYSNNSDTIGGADVLRLRYFYMIKKMWEKEGAYSEMADAAAKMMVTRLPNSGQNFELFNPDITVKENTTNAATEFIAKGIKIAQSIFKNSVKENQKFADLGWGGAGIWYNQIAKINGELVDSIASTPEIAKYPEPMQYVCAENKQQNQNTKPEECFKAKLAKGRDIQGASVLDMQVARALGDVFDYWYRNSNDKTGNVIIDVITVMLGIDGLFSMCKNADAHPLAQLSTLGKNMISAAIRNLGAGVGGSAASILGGYFGPSIKAASSFLTTIAGIGILMGFILFYLVPFLPFLYFMFAVGGWVKGIFEAMVGVPLWALAHIRIDGEGLPGEAAINGYFLIFEIFIRPILILFGLLASILIFGAMVKVLNDLFALVVSNLSGFDTTTNGCVNSGVKDTGNPQTDSIEYFRGPVDEFFFTIVYAILVYMIGMSSFKLIDMIPNNILRWMGHGVQTFNDQAGEPAEGLLQKMAIGGSVLGGQLQSAGSSLGQSVGHFSNAAKGPPKQ